MNNKHRIGKIILALAILLMVMPMAVEAETYRYSESFTMEELSEKTREGWTWMYLYVCEGYSDLPGIGSGGWDTEIFFPTVNVPTTIKFSCHYGLEKYVQGDTFMFYGMCTQTCVYFDIYKNGVVVDNYVNSTDSHGKVKFTVNFREPGYYGYKAYTLEQKKQGEIPEDIETFYVQPVQTSTLTPTPAPVVVDRSPRTAFVVEGVCAGIDVTVDVFHHGGDTITDAFKSTAVANDLGNKWANFEMRLNGAKVNQDKARGLWMNDKSYTDAWKANFESGDQLTITFDELKPDDSIVVLHTPSDSILQRVTVIGGEVPSLLQTHLSELTPETTSIPEPEATQLPQVDSDSDGVPDEYDYAPHDPEVQTKSDAKTPGFGAIFAIGGLLAVACLILRRRG